MLKRHEVKLLRGAGHTQQQVAESTKVSTRSVRRIEAEPPVASLDDEAERARRKIGRPSKLQAFRNLIVAMLVAEPELMALEVLRRIREDGYAGSKSALYALVKEVRPIKQRVIARFEGLAGEFCQHDFGHVEVRFVDGTKKLIHFFASRLKWSRWAQVSIVPNERVESLVRSLVAHYEAMGGVPLRGVFDRPKTIALEWREDGTVTKWNPTFLATVGELGIGVELCWPYQPQQKGAVENLVKWVKGSFFKPRRFLDEADLQRQLERWHVEVNHERPSRATKETPLARMQREELSRLRPLRIRSSALELRYPVQVGPTATVSFDGCVYSMPPQAMGIVGTLHLGAKTVRIVAGKWAATHPRLFEPGAKSMLPEHRASMLAAMSSHRARNYTKREHLLALGENSRLYLTEIVHRRERTWMRDVDTMHELLELHGEDAMRAAIDAALRAQTFGGEYVAHQLGELDRISRMVFESEGVQQ
jgi:transposase